MGLFCSRCIWPAAFSVNGGEAPGYGSVGKQLLLWECSVRGQPPPGLRALRHVNAGAAARLNFGPFSLRNHGEALYFGDDLVRVGSRARHILAFLAARPGQVVLKSEIMAEVWPNTNVGENNLTVHIAALRHALGDGRDGAQYIVNVPGRGYRFVATISQGLSNETQSPGVTNSPPTNLPARLAPAIGITQAIDEISGKLRTSNLITVTGPAGVGKTTVALQVAKAVAMHYPGGTWLVDLAPLRDGEHVPAALATAMQIQLGAGNPENTLLAALRRSKTLLLLDNCEHLLDVVARLAAAIVQQCPDVVLLTTSREQLRVRDETIYALSPLSTPPLNAAMTAQEALAFPAVQLFVERVRASTNDFALSDRNVGAAISICHRLDGLPLAIEFASALVGAFGLAGLAAGLHDRFRLTRTDMRAASQRHGTLTTALDWSYDILSANEQQALKRLAVFAGGFTLEGAAAVIGVQDVGEAGGLLARLHAKSLIASDTSSEDPRFRLLETTRAYALEKLELTDDANDVRLRHAAYFRDLLRRNRIRLSERDMARDEIELDNIRAALRFAMGRGGDLGIALSLASAAVPVWLGVSLMSECQARLHEVLALLTHEQAMSAEGWDLELTGRITEMATVGTPDAAYERWAEPPPMAPGEPHTRLPYEADLSVRFVRNMRAGDAAKMKQFGSRYVLLVKEDHSLRGQVTPAWVEGISAFYSAEFEQAKSHLQRFVETETPQLRRVFIGRTGIDRLPHVRGMLASVLCLLGDVDQGLREARLAEDAGRVHGRAWSILEGKIYAALAYEIAGYQPADWRIWIEQFLDLARSQALESSFAYGLGLQGALALRQQNYAEAEDLLRQSVDQLRRTGYECLAPWFHSLLSRSVAQQGRIQEGLDIVQSWMQYDRNPDGWYGAELHRAIGHLHALGGRDDDAEHSFAEALSIANKQGAVAWARRARHDLNEIQRSA
jgi:predicted ATPase/DNA-binding winged helix-turn-helix (wHTH) protein